MDEAISRAADILKYEPLKEEQRKAKAGFLSGIMKKVCIWKIGMH